MSASGLLSGMIRLCGEQCDATDPGAACGCGQAAPDRHLSSIDWATIQGPSDRLSVQYAGGDSVVARRKAKQLHIHSESELAEFAEPELLWALLD